METISCDSRNLRVKDTDLRRWMRGTGGGDELGCGLDTTSSATTSEELCPQLLVKWA